jgi:hypothetical protein
MRQSSWFHTCAATLPVCGVSSVQARCVASYCNATHCTHTHTHTHTHTYVALDSWQTVAVPAAPATSCCCNCCCCCRVCVPPVRLLPSLLPASSQPRSLQRWHVTHKRKCNTHVTTPTTHCGVQCQSLTLQQPQPRGLRGFYQDDVCMGGVSVAATRGVWPGVL